MASTDQLLGEGVRPLTVPPSENLANTLIYSQIWCSEEGQRNPYFSIAQLKVRANMCRLTAMIILDAARTHIAIGHRCESCGCTSLRVDGQAAERWDGAARFAALGTYVLRVSMLVTWRTSDDNSTVP
jgi:hypothetical protein